MGLNVKTLTSNISATRRNSPVTFFRAKSHRNFARFDAPRLSGCRVLEERDARIEGVHGSGAV